MFKITIHYLLALVLPAMSDIKFSTSIATTTTTTNGGEIQCFETITANRKGHHLKANLTCTGCVKNTALTLKGPAVLDLNGYTVSCDSDDSHGIHIIGTGATLENGVVETTGGSSSVAVLIQGRGEHTVRDISVKTANVGFQLDGGSSNKLVNCQVKYVGDGSASSPSGIWGRENSHKNTISECVIGGFHGPGNTIFTGMFFNGQGNTLVNNEVMTCGLHGISFLSNDNVAKNNTIHDSRSGVGIYSKGDSNHIVDNEIFEYGVEGISLDGGADNVVNRNNVYKNWQGIVVKGGVANVVVDNNVVENDSDGIRVSGQSHRIANNMISENGFDGIYLGGGNDHGNNLVFNNTVANNGKSGILLGSSATGNVILGNNVTGHSSSAGGHLDINMDGDDACTENIWWENTFITSNQACVGDGLDF